MPDVIFPFVLVHCVLLHFILRPLHFTLFFLDASPLPWQQSRVRSALVVVVAVIVAVAVAFAAVVATAVVE